MNNLVSGELTVGIDETDPLALGFVEHFTAATDSATRSRQFEQGPSENGLKVWQGTIRYGENAGDTVVVKLLVGPANLLGTVDFRVRSSTWFQGRGFLLGRQALSRCKDLTLDAFAVSKGRVLILPAQPLSDKMLRCAANELTARLTRPDPDPELRVRKHRRRARGGGHQRNLSRSGFGIVGASLTRSESAVPTSERQLAGVAS